MKILHVIPFFAPAWRYGGPVTVVLGLTRELARQGHDITVMTTNIDGPNDLDVPLESPVTMEGVEVWYYPVQRPRWYCFSRPLARALRERVSDYDIVHVHSIFLWPTTVAAFWSRKRKVPYLLHPAGALDPTTLSKSYASWRVSVSSRVKKWLYLKTLGRLDVNRATAVHFTSQADLEVSRALKVRPPGYVLPFGVSLDDMDETIGGPGLRQRFPELEGRKIVLFLSRLDPIKGLDILISALGGLSAMRSDFALVVAGAGTRDYESYIASLVARHGLQDRTVFLGMVQPGEKWSVLRDADVFVLASRHENFPMAVLEAMAAGVPIVISDRVKIHKEISEAGAGLVTGLDPDEVSAAVNMLLSDEDLRRRMGGEGEALTRGPMSWDQAARDIARDYENIVGIYRGGPMNTLSSSRG